MHFTEVEIAVESLERSSATTTCLDHSIPHLIQSRTGGLHAVITQPVIHIYEFLSLIRSLLVLVA